MRRTAVALALCALVGVTSANAHPGDIWYGTAAGTAKNIEAKYSSVSIARCWPLPESLRARYDADSYVSGGVRDGTISSAVLRSAAGVCASRSPT